MTSPETFTPYFDDDEEYEMAKRGCQCGTCDACRDRLDGTDEEPCDNCGDMTEEDHSDFGSPLVLCASCQYNAHPERWIQGDFDA